MTASITPLPLPAPHSSGAADLILAGGTFDPPHRAHLSLAELARDRFGGPGAWLVFVPAARSPHKSGPPDAEDAHRVEMLRLATRGVERCAVWTDELDRARSGEASYFIDTLRRAAKVASGRSLKFIIGADQAAQFHRWRDPRGILDIAEPIVLPRAPIFTRADLRDAMAGVGAWDDGECRWWGDRLLAAPPVDASATEVREQLRRGEGDGPWLESRVGTEVASYILAHGLYAPRH